MSLFAGVDPAIQKAALRASLVWHRLFSRRRPFDWTVGPGEVAGLVQAISALVPSSESAIMNPHPFYDFHYDWVAPRARTRIGNLVRGPWKLGDLISRSGGFVYIGGAGFLDRIVDSREYEFSFLKRHGKSIVCYFTGNDIRSPRLSAAHEQRSGEPNLATYLAETSPEFATDGYEASKQALARSAEQHADLIFNADIDQIGYLTEPSEDFLYFHPDGQITADLSKYDRVDRPIIVHAPSSPIIKGTPIVRAAVAALREEGYEFEYIELIRQPHAEVKASLERAHIVLNQFYAEVPGVFGVEALAAGCVVMMSARPEAVGLTEADGDQDPWVVTRHHQIHRNLRALLDDRSSWRTQGELGIEWVRSHAAVSVTGAVLRTKLAEVRAHADTASDRL